MELCVCVCVCVCTGKREKRKETAVSSFSFPWIFFFFSPKSPLGPPTCVYEYVILHSQNSDLRFSLWFLKNVIPLHPSVIYILNDLLVL